MPYPPLPLPEITVPEFPAKDQVQNTDILIITDEFGKNWKVPAFLLAAYSTESVSEIALQVGIDKEQTGLDRIAVAENAAAVETARQQVEQVRDEVVGVAARKIDNWQVDTMADAVAFSATLPGSAFIEVLEDETQGGVRALYFWNTVELQEPLLL